MKHHVSLLKLSSTEKKLETLAFCVYCGILYLRISNPIINARLTKAKLIVQKQSERGWDFV